MSEEKIPFGRIHPEISMRVDYEIVSEPRIPKSVIVKISPVRIGVIFNPAPQVTPVNDDLFDHE